MTENSFTVRGEMHVQGFNCDGETTGLTLAFQLGGGDTMRCTLIASDYTEEAGAITQMSQALGGRGWDARATGLLRETKLGGVYLEMHTLDAVYLGEGGPQMFTWRKGDGIYDCG